MRNTRRTLVGAAAAGVLATGLALMPASAMVMPPEPEVGPVEDSAPSPAMTAGRAWCACNGVTYGTLWIE
jgi:hypothetical protein